MGHVMVRNTSELQQYSANTSSPANLMGMARLGRIVAPGVAHRITQRGGDDPQIAQITQIGGKVLPPLLRICGSEPASVFIITKLEQKLKLGRRRARCPAAGRENKSTRERGNRAFPGIN